MELIHTVSGSRDGQTILSILRFERFSSSMIRRLRRQGGITINGTPAGTRDRVRAGDKVEIRIPDSKVNAVIAPEFEPVTVLYEDEALIALSKPQGLIVHPTAGRISGTLSNYLLGYLQNNGHPSGLHIITRLDRDTGGIVLFAKNAHIHALMMQHLNDGLLEKEYEALVYGSADDSGRINFPISRPDPASMKRSASHGGAEAVTEYKTLKRYTALGQDISLLRLYPLTGRTHQLRVHCLASGFPILGDSMYGHGDSIWLSDELRIKMQQLFARRLAFPHPLTKQYIEIRDV